MVKPTSVNILGRVYTITYCDKPSDVDLYKCASLWGQVDCWTRTIRVYDNGRQFQDLLETIIHEILHALAADLHMTKTFSRAGTETDVHDELDILATGLADMLTRNGWLKEGA